MGRVDGELGHDGAGEPRDDRRFALVAALVGEIEPVPAGGRVGARSLGRIGDAEAALLGEPVHARADREVVGPLGATVQHDDQRDPAALGAARDIELIVPRAGGRGEVSREPGGALRRGDGRRWPQPSGRGGPTTKARELDLAQHSQNLAERTPRAPGRPARRVGRARVRCLDRLRRRIRRPGDLRRGR